MDEAIFFLFQYLFSKNLINISANLKKCQDGMHIESIREERWMDYGDSSAHLNLVRFFVQNTVIRLGLAEFRKTIKVGQKEHLGEFLELLIF